MSKREKVLVPNILVFMLLGLHVSDLKAGVLDFQLLDKAKTSYESGDYNESSKFYSKYLASHNSAKSQYNLANANYKKGNYKAAAVGYEQIHTDDKNLQFNSLHNLGNSYAKQGDMNSLKKAVSAYEKALKIKDDKDTKENLEAVKKLYKNNKKSKNNRKNKIKTIKSVITQKRVTKTIRINKTEILISRVIKINRTKILINKKIRISKTRRILINKKIRISKTEI
jgi:Ca-activated chloride channel family protein